MAGETCMWKQPYTLTKFYIFYLIQLLFLWVHTTETTLWKCCTEEELDVSGSAMWHGCDTWLVRHHRWQVLPTTNHCRHWVVFPPEKPISRHVLWFLKGFFHGTQRVFLKGKFEKHIMCSMGKTLWKSQNVSLNGFSRGNTTRRQQWMLSCL